MCGRNAIPTVEENVSRSLFRDDEFDTLLDVMREFGQYTGTTLVTLTHKPGTPWSNAISSGRTIISEQEIQSYFTDHPIPHFKNQITIPQVDALPFDWYDPDEDAEWEAHL